MDDALLIAETALKLDPENGQVRGLLETLKSFKKQSAADRPAQASLQQLEDELKNNPTNNQAALDLAKAYGQTEQTSRRTALLEAMMQKPDLDTSVLLQIAQQFAEMNNVPGLEAALERLVKVAPAIAESWYDLAALKATLNKSSEALAALKQALDLSAARLKSDSTARDLLEQARQDARFNALRQTPEYKALVPQ